MCDPETIIQTYLEIKGNRKYAQEALEIFKSEIISCNQIIECDKDKILDLIEDENGCLEEVKNILWQYPFLEQEFQKVLVERLSSKNIYT